MVKATLFQPDRIRFISQMAALAVRIGGVASVVLLCAGMAEAAVVRVDFNDLIGTTPFNLSNQTGGTGFIDNWSTQSTVPKIVAGELIAPPSTSFNVDQTSDTPQFLEMQNPTAERQNNRALEVELTGTVWLSFLVNVSEGQAAGVGFNVPSNFSTFTFVNSLLARGSDLWFDTDASTMDNEVIASGVVPLGQDNLILAKIDLVNETLDAWVNPDLLTALPSPDLSAPTTGRPMTSISRLAVGGLNFGKLDSVLLSDNSTGFTDVTGQPFVSTLVPGDFDGDGDVDGADFVIWQTNFPTESGATLATGDADGDGDVDGADFVIWQTNFPFTPAPAAAPVPEPAAWLLAIFSLAGLAPRFGCGSRSHRVRKQE